ncbi:MDR family MFS transporter [Deinococcus roseus]|uniref:MFS transporter n=1 Tax=Deinococcus roseus TaxID=392414 RepID=A0ABQ2D046_9DEIO|nr:MFS transporter [Deinococcus roseus]GGJ37727.1 MFS transporter [Deinococcus roseus]
MDARRPLIQRILPVLPRQFWILWWGTLINRVGDFVVPFLSYYLTSQLLWSTGQAALALSLFGVGSFLAQFLAGFVTDRLGRKKVMVFSMVGGALMMVGISEIRHFYLLLAVIVLQGFIMNTSRPGMKAAVADLVPPEGRIRAYGMNYWAINLGAAIAPLLAGLLADQNYRYLFYGDALTSAGCGLLMLFFFRETLSKHQRTTSQKMRMPQDGLLYAYTVAGFLFGVLMMQGFGVLSLAMQKLHFTAAQFGHTIAINGLIIVLLGIPAQMVLPRFPRPTVMAISALLMGGGLMLNMLAHDLTGFMVAVVVWTLGELGMNTVASSVIADLAPAHLRGTYAGLNGASWGLAAMVAPVFGGWLLGSHGSLTLWSACGLIGLVVAIMHVVLAGPLKRRMQHATE